jgi:DNA-binding beta-propeller fold protein YncE
MLRCSRLALGIGLAVMLLSSGLSAQEEKKKGPSWPHVNVALAYTHDPSWPQKPAEFKWAEMAGIAADAKDNIYIFTRSTPPVQVYDSSGKFIRAFGQDIVKAAHHIKIDRDGNVWAADVGGHQVLKFSPEGKMLLTLGTKGVSGRDATHFYQPTDMAITPAGDIFVSDGYGNARIVHFDKTGKFVKEWGELGSKPGQFSIPHAICVDSKGRLYVADRNNVRIQVFDPSGKLLDVWSNIIVPWGFHITKDDEIWVCGSSPMQWRTEDGALGCPPKDQVFMKFNTAGKLLQLWTVPKGADGLEKPGELNWVHCITEDSKGNLYAGDIKGKKAQKFALQKP